MRITGTPLASGSITALSEEKHYKWRGFEPGDPRFREPEEPKGLSRGGNSVADKQARFARFRHLIEAEGKTPEEAGKAIGIAPRTAGKYEEQRKKIVKQEAAQ